MQQSELTYCANRAGVLRGTVRRAKGVTNAQSTRIIVEAIAIADDIAARLRAQLPEGTIDELHDSVDRIPALPGRSARRRLANRGL